MIELRHGQRSAGARMLVTVTFPTRRSNAWSERLAAHARRWDTQYAPGEGSVSRVTRRTMRADASALIDLELSHDAPGWLASLGCWFAKLLDSLLPAWASRTKRLRSLRTMCRSLLDDVRTEPGQALRDRIHVADNANEFWHMRPRIFDAISEVHGERAAAERLSKLDTELRLHHDRRSQFSRTISTAPSQAAALSTQNAKLSNDATGRRRRAADRAKH